MATKRELFIAEDAGWVELCEVMKGLSDEHLEVGGIHPQSEAMDAWSAKDLLAHVGCWMAESGRILEQIRMGTYRAEPYDVEAMNVECYEANRDLSPGMVRAELASARNRMLLELDALKEVTADAEEWFLESGQEHYAEHVPRLKGWAEELRSRS